MSLDLLFCYYHKLVCSLLVSLILYSHVVIFKVVVYTSSLFIHKCKFAYVLKGIPPFVFNMRLNLVF